jgi:hypothetical protein
VISQTQYIFNALQPSSISISTHEMSKNSRSTRYAAKLKSNTSRRQEQENRKIKLLERYVWRIVCVHSTHCNIQLFMQFSVVISPRAYIAQHFFPSSQEYYKNIAGKNDAPRRRYLTDCRMVCSIQFGSALPSWSCLGAILCRGWGVLARRACIIAG